MSTIQSRPLDHVDVVAAKYMDALLRVAGEGYYLQAHAVHVCMVLALQELTGSHAVYPAGPQQDKVAALSQQVADMQNDNAELTQQLIQMDRDNAHLTQRINEDGAAVKPATSPADDIDWNTIGVIADDFLISLSTGRRVWSAVPKPIRLEIIQHVLGQNTPDGKPMTMARYDAIKPVWMPTASGLPTVFGCSWKELATLQWEAA